MLILNIDAWMSNYITHNDADNTVLDNVEAIEDIFRRFKCCFTADNGKSRQLLDLICDELRDSLIDRLDYLSDEYEDEVSKLSEFVEFLMNKDVNRILVHPLYTVLNNNLEEKQSSSYMYTIENLGDIARIDTGNYQYLHDVELIDMVSYAGYFHYISDDAMKQYHTALTRDTLSLMTSILAGRTSGKDITSTHGNIPQFPPIMSKLDIPGRDAIYEYLNGIVDGETDYMNNVYRLIALINPQNIKDFGNCNKFAINYLAKYYELYYRVLYDTAKHIRGFIKQEKYLMRLIEYTYRVYIRNNSHALVGMMLRVCVGVVLILGHNQPYTLSHKLIPYQKILKNCKNSRELESESTDLLTALLICEESAYSMLDEVGDIDYFQKLVLTMFSSGINTEGLQESMNGAIVDMESPSHLMTTLTESFEVLRDGTIKVTLPTKTTFMNEYATNHRLLKYNEQHGNYEGMKYNLIYHMILIENIEKNVLFNRKVNKDSELYKDAQKAHSFAKNDISIYLPKIKEHDRDFDINGFYKKIKADKATVTINGVETALGLKRIFSSILLK